MLPLDHERAIGKILGMKFYCVTTEISAYLRFESDHYADDETAAVKAHLDAFHHFHPNDGVTYSTTWREIRPPGAPIAIGGYPA